MSSGAGEARLSRKHAVRRADRKDRSRRTTHNLRTSPTDMRKNSHDALHRRSLLAAGGALLASAAQAQRPNVADSSQIGWDEFLTRALAAARPLAADRTLSGQDAYLHAIAQHAVRLAELPPVDPEEFGGLEPSYSFDMLHAGAPFAVIYWRMEAGAIYPAHNHPGTNVCTLCTGGSALVRNFHLGADAPPIDERNQSFDVFETGHCVLEAGVVNMITEHRSNLHWFEAGARGAEGIDISTTYGRMRPFSFLRLGELSTGAARLRRYSARWVGNDPRRAGASAVLP
jgi:hypothetical protein